MNYPDPERQFADQAFRKMLNYPLNLQAFLQRVAPSLAPYFDYDNMREVPRNFMLDDWKDRECDILIEVPYRNETESPVEVLVCVLIEHQSQSDWRMAFRTLLYAMLYWERQLRDWEQAKPEDRSYGGFRFTPVIPIVLHAATTTWGSPRTFAELIDGPNVLKVFAPKWAPLFWELGQHSSADLLNSTAAFDQFLALVRANDSSAAEFEPILRQVFATLQQMQGNRVYLSDMLNMVALWALWKRPGDEQAQWSQRIDEMVQDEDERRRIKAMPKSYLKSVYEEAEAKGELRSTRRFLLRTARDRFSDPTEAQLKMVEDCESLDTLEQWRSRLITAQNWDELLQS